MKYIHVKYILFPLVAALVATTVSAPLAGAATSTTSPVTMRTLNASLPSKATELGYKVVARGRRQGVLAFGVGAPKQLATAPGAGVTLTHSGNLRLSAGLFAVTTGTAVAATKAWGTGGRTVRIGRLAYIKSSTRGAPTIRIVFAVAGAVGVVRYVDPNTDVAHASIAAQGIARQMVARIKSARATTPVEQLLDRIPANGNVSKDLALQLFAATYGSIPGYPAPSGRVVLDEGTLAGTAVMAHWAKLTAAQRAAIRSKLDLPMPANGSRRDRLRASGTSARAASARTMPNEKTAAWAAGIAKYTAYFNEKLGVTYPYQIRVFDSSDLAKNARADAYPIDVTGEYARGDDIYYCRIRVLASLPTNSTVLAHEIFHCFEFYLTDRWAEAHYWRIEGLAQWAQSHFEPRIEWYGTYLTDMGEPLPSMSYEAVGFWSLIQEQRGDDFLWNQIGSQDLLEWRDDIAFEHVGGEEAAFLDSWASKSMGFASLGSNWTQKLPYPTLDRGAPQYQETESGIVQVPPFVRIFTYVVAGKQVIHLERRGNAHVRAGVQGHDFGPVSDEWYCRDNDCDCKENWTTAQPLPTPLYSRKLGVAMSAGRLDGSVSIDIMSLAEWRAKFCELRVGNITGTVTSDYQRHYNVGGDRQVDVTEHVAVTVNLKYVGFDPKTGEFGTITDAGSTMTASYSAVDNYDPAGCGYLRETDTGTFSGAVDAMVSTGGWTMGTPSGVGYGTGSNVREVQSWDFVNCNTDPPITSDRGSGFSIPPAVVSFPPGTRTVTFNEQWGTDATTGITTITGSLTF